VEMGACAESAFDPESAETSKTMQSFQNVSSHVTCKYDGGLQCM
jgi:hypothetical protein